MKKQSLFFISIMAGMMVCSCSASKEDFSCSSDGRIWFRSSDIRLRFDPNMVVAVYVLHEKAALNVVDEATKPADFIVVDGKEVTGFAVDKDRVRKEPVETLFGKGNRLTVTGIADLGGGMKIEKTITVELYEKFPDAALITAEYRNTGITELTIGTVVSGYLKMDASRFDRDAEPFDFWSWQGASVEWGLDCVFRLKDGFSRENWMGVQPETKTGGGVPFVDLWQKSGGVAIAHLEKEPQLVSFPVKVDASGMVNISIEKKTDRKLAPGESLTGIKTAIIVHSLDYFNALRTYSRLMAAQGLKMKQPSEGAHEASWCSWGYLTDFSLDDIYGTLPKVKEMGIRWVVLDDRWWDKYGDWNPRNYTFPGGEKQVKEFVDSLHSQGFLVRIWWAPSPVQPDVLPSFKGSVDPGMAKVANDHPEWLVMNEDGSYARDNRDMYQLCPAVSEVHEYLKELTTRFIRDWGFDGHKLDAFYVVQPCYNPDHHHSDPGESFRKFPQLIQTIYETSKALKPGSVTMICNCGTTQDFYQQLYTDQPAVSDPTSGEQVRRRIKSMKALWGPGTPIDADHVEHIRISGDMNDKSNTARVGRDFASATGPGGVIGTKFTWPAGPANMQLTPEKEQHWKKWTQLYREKILSKGTYLNLYDLVYDRPETHLIKKGQVLYYAFYADDWKGTVELRGLESKKYRVYDYVNQVDLGKIKGPVAKISTSFSKHLLIECTPLD